MLPRGAWAVSKDTEVHHARGRGDDSQKIVYASRIPPRPLGGLEAWRIGGEEAWREEVKIQL